MREKDQHAHTDRCGNFQNYSHQLLHEQIQFEQNTQSSQQRNYRPKVKKQWKIYREILSLFMETISGITASMILILDVGSCFTISNIKSNITMVSSELLIIPWHQTYFGILKGREHNGETVKQIAGSKHLSLRIKDRFLTYTLMIVILSKENREAISEKTCSLR